MMTRHEGPSMRARGGAGGSAGAEACTAAFTLIEALVCMVIVGVMIVAALGTIGGAADARRRTYEMSRSQATVSALLAEVLAGYYEDPNGAPVFGPEAGETAQPRTFDDTDDYAAFEETPPRNRDGTVIEGLEGWTWTVEVRGAVVDLAGITPTNSETGARLIVVTLMGPDGVARASAAGLRSRWSLSQEKPAEGVIDADRAVLRARAGDGGVEVRMEVELANVPEMP